MFGPNFLESFSRYSWNCKNRQAWSWHAIFDSKVLSVWAYLIIFVQVSSHFITCNNVIKKIDNVLSDKYVLVFILQRVSMGHSGNIFHVCINDQRKPLWMEPLHILNSSVNILQVTFRPLPNIYYTLQCNCLYLISFWVVVIWSWTS